jgi:GWxTD domain-containing protein
VLATVLTLESCFSPAIARFPAGRLIAMTLSRSALIGLMILLCFSPAGMLLEAQSANTADGAPGQADPLRRAPHGKPKPTAAEKAYKQWLDEDVKYIITPEERNAFLKLTNDAEREAFIEFFWQHRNPNPDNEQNEYKEEHYRRIAFANERFAAGVPGWKTDRGRIYIIHGAPDSIESHPMGGPYIRSAEEGGGQTETFPFEVWHYRNLDGIGQSIDIEFVDTCGCGEYHAAIDRGEKDALARVPNAGPTESELSGHSTKAGRFGAGVETLGPSLLGIDPHSKEFERIEQNALIFAPPPIPGSGIRSRVSSTIRTNLLPFDVRVDFVKADNKSVLTPITVEIPNRGLSYVAKDGIQRAVLNLSGTVVNLSGTVIATFDDPLRLDVPADQLESFASGFSLYQEALTLRPGLYRLDVMLRDVNGDKLGIFAQSIRVPDFSDQEKLAASTLILADLVDPVPPREIGLGKFVLGSEKVRPKVPPSREPATFGRDQRVNLWMQVYNLALDSRTERPSATVEYNIVSLASGKPVWYLLQTTGQMGNVGKQLTLEQHLAAGNLEPGLYQVTVKVTDLIGEQTIAPQAQFAIK